MINSEILKNTTVLYVEDEELIIKGTAPTLEKLFKKVYIAKNGEEGLQLYKENKISIDVVISDINMPIKNGLEMVGDIKKIDCDMPCIITTAHTSSEYLLEAIELGIKHYATKPLKIANLLLQIQEIMKVKYQYLQTLKAQNERNEFIEIINKVAIITKSDTQGNITYANKMFCDISGYSQEELIGKPHNIVRHPNVPKEDFKQMWETIQSGKTWEGKLPNKAKNGDTYVVKATIFPIFDEFGHDIIEFMSVRFVVTDMENEKKEILSTLDTVSEQRKKDKILFEQSKLASLGEMIGNIAHQWRQPLNTISTIASSVNLNYEFGVEVTEEKMKENMNLIIGKTQYLSETIDTFANFIKEKKEIKTIILQERIDKALEIIKATLENEHITLNNQINYNKPIDITMVVGEIGQVIINIINNAKDILLEKEIKEPWVKISLTTENNNAVITIEDNGGGIPEDIIKKIFEPYFTTKHQSQGTGLGLHMSYKIITESLKGNLYVKNSDFGAKFFIELPLSNT